MERFSNEQRWEIIKFYFQSNESVAETARKLRTKYGREMAPSRFVLANFFKRARETGSLNNKKTRKRESTVRTAENIAVVAEDVRDRPTTSTRQRSQQLDISRTSLRRILHKDLGMTPYKVQLTQQLKPYDHLARFRFAKWAQERLDGDEGFGRKIIFSDEAHFHLGGYVNKQNCRIWGTENPHVIVEKPMHPERVTVWCGLWAGGIIGPFFFEDRAGRAVTVNGERYRAMITDFLWPIIDQMDVEDIWFQQDGAPCHTSNATIDLLREKFGERVISRRAEVAWPPRSCDLTPLDYYLWGAVKDKCYAKNPQTIEDLKAEIGEVIGQIQPHTLENVVKNWSDRIGYCHASHGSHMNDVVFHH